ncbi:MarR family transcriptional regulator [Knoellia sp. DB2414S]|uniref:MarR family transcriptional regulator n=2 Tax=Knoellia koreensis TaxID=2730921 RepID=A0A849HIZ9_9MICO|nr:MarR family transcriptional regulator [Knoellia sp. DB2414S]
MMGIDPEGTRVSVLADRAQVAKQTATALVDKLERAGYVERVPDPTDGRARLVRLTTRAEAAIPHARAEEDRIEAEWEAHLGPRRMRQLRDALTALRDITDPYQ